LVQIPFSLLARKSPYLPHREERTYKDTGEVLASPELADGGAVNYNDSKIAWTPLFFLDPCSMHSGVEQL